MSQYSDFILFFVNLTINLCVFGFLVAISVTISFRLIVNASPRLRYLISVGAFLIAVIIPLIATFNGSIELFSLIKKRQYDFANSVESISQSQTAFTIPANIAVSGKPPLEKLQTDFLGRMPSIFANSSLGIIFVGLWCLGSVSFILRDVVSYRRLTKLRRSWRPATGLERLKLNIPDDTEIYYGNEGPATVGLFQRIIVLPEIFPEDISLESKRFIIQHELSHVRWCDPLVNIVLRQIRMLFWISPALWLFERMACAERESAADFAAVKSCSADNPEFDVTILNYANTLVSMAKSFNPATRKVNTIGLSGGGGLENRIERLFAHSKYQNPWRMYLVLMILAGNLIGLFFVPVAFRPNQPEIQATTLDQQVFEEFNENRNPDKLIDLSYRVKNKKSDLENPMPDKFEINRNRYSNVAKRAEDQKLDGSQANRDESSINPDKDKLITDSIITNENDAKNGQTQTNIHINHNININRNINIVRNF